MDHHNHQEHRSALQTYCKTYILCSIIFLVCIFLIPETPYIIAIGAHAPLSIFYFYLLICLENIIGEALFWVGLLITELVFLVVFILSAYLAVKKEIELPLLVISLVSHIISLIIPIITFSLVGSITLPIDYIFGYIGNTIFCILFYRQYFKEKRAGQQ